MKIKIILWLIFFMYPNVAMSTEIAEYIVLEKISDNIEIREYKSLILAKTSQNEKSTSSNFRALFKFITGDNEQGEKINMTAPVFRETVKNQEYMSFVMPKTLNMDNIPTPRNDNIKIEFLQNVKFIVITFSGRSNDKNFYKYRKILENKVIENNIEANLRHYINAYYNRPFTLPFRKRNEVLFQLN